MTIKQHGGVFGRNPTFKDVTIEGDITLDGTAIPDPSTILVDADIGTIASQDADSVNIDGGAVDGVTLGTNSAVTEAQIDNININGNTVSTTNTNGNVILNPDGSGKLDLRADIAMPKNVNREFSIAQSDPNDSGANLTIKAGSSGTGGASAHGGDLILYAGDGFTGDPAFLGGDVKIYAGGNVVGDARHGSIYFYVKGTTHTMEAARLKPSGNLAFPSGQGIDFSATAGTGTSELFDDYEEGAWTPTVTAGSGSITSYSSSGTYTKVGRVVTISGVIQITNNGTGASYLDVAGLPFTIGAQGGSGAVRSSGFGGHLVAIQAPNGGTTFTMWKYDNTYPVGTNSLMNFSFSYFV